MHKKYIVFGFDRYYPAGGLDDIQFETDDLEEARQYVAQKNYDFNFIVDRDRWEEVPEPNDDQ